MERIANEDEVQVSCVYWQVNKKVILVSIFVEELLMFNMEHLGSKKKIVVVSCPNIGKFL